MSTNENCNRLADAFNVAIARSDADAYRSLFTPNAVIWHNNDRIERTVDGSVGGIAALHQLLRDVDVDVIRREATACGFVQQFALRATIASTGVRLDLQHCIVAIIEADKISRIDEYVDQTAVARLAGEAD